MWASRITNIGHLFVADVDWVMSHIRMSQSRNKTSIWVRRITHIGLLFVAGVEWVMARSYVRHDYLMHMCAITHPTSATNKSSICVAWLVRIRVFFLLRRIHACVMTHPSSAQNKSPICVIWLAYVFVLSLVLGWCWMSDGTLMHEVWHAYERVMSHVWTRPASAWINRFMNETCHKYECVISHISCRLGLGPGQEYLASWAWVSHMNEPCHTLAFKWVIQDLELVDLVCLRSWRVSRMNESWHTLGWGMSHT